MEDYELYLKSKPKHMWWSTWQTSGGIDVKQEKTHFSYDTESGISMHCIYDLQYSSCPTSMHLKK